MPTITTTQIAPTGMARITATTPTGPVTAIGCTDGPTLVSLDRPGHREWAEAPDGLTTDWLLQHLA